MQELLEYPGVSRSHDEAAPPLLELLRHLSACVGVYAPDGTCLLASESLGRWLDQPADALVGRRAHEIWPREFARRQADRLREAMRSGPIQATEEFPSALGPRPVRVVRFSWRESGVVAGVVELFEEQTDLSGRAETVGRLALGIAHDLNNALTLVQGQADLAEHSQTHGVPTSLAELRHAVDHACQLPRQLLHFVRGGTPDARRVDLNALLVSIGGLIRPRLGGVAVAFDLSPGGAWVEGDPVQLTQIFLNLSLNALDAMPQAGQLTFRTQCHGAMTRVTLTDTGTGMTREVSRRLFEPLHTTRGHGHGLGLSVVRELVQRHGGRLACETEPGRGTTFWIDLPVRQKAHDEAESRGVVLVVDRDTDVRRLTGMILGQGGHASLLAGDLVEARQRAEESREPVRLVLLDAELAAARSESELNALLEAVPEAKLLYLSTGQVFAPHQPEDRRVVAKPFRAEQLLRAVEGAMG